jgi:hypothetical protein
MSYRQRPSMIPVFALLAMVCTFLPGCKPPKRAEPVTVRIFRDPVSPYATELDRRILDFQATQPRLPNGTVIQVGSLSRTDLRSAVNNMNDPVVDIVILNSPADALDFPSLQGEMSHAVNICAAVQACPADVPALVPSKLQGERAEAANKFLDFLEHAKPAPPAPEPAPAQTQPAPPPPAH